MQTLVTMSDQVPEGSSGVVSTTVSTDVQIVRYAYSRWKSPWKLVRTVTFYRKVVQLEYRRKQPDGAGGYDAVLPGDGSLMVLLFSGDGQLTGFRYGELVGSLQEGHGRAGYSLLPRLGLEGVVIPPRFQEHKPPPPLVPVHLLKPKSGAVHYGKPGTGELLPGKMSTGRWLTLCGLTMTLVEVPASKYPANCQNCLAAKKARRGR